MRKWCLLLLKTRNAFRRSAPISVRIVGADVLTHVPGMAARMVHECNNTQKPSVSPCAQSTEAQGDKGIPEYLEQFPPGVLRFDDILELHLFLPEAVLRENLNG
jgi:hypothetical protein